MVKFITLKATCQRTSLSRSTIERLAAAGHFPKPIRLTERRLAFVESEVEAWLQEKLAPRSPEPA